MSAQMAEFGFHETPNVRTEACETHGEFESTNRFRDVWSKCPACAKERLEQDEAREAERQRRESIAEWERALGTAGIPERFRSRTLESYRADSPQQQAALRFATDYANNFPEVTKSGRGGVFIGKPGTGKTHLAVGIALAIMEDGYSALFTTAMRALRRVKETWSRDSEETEREAIAALVYPHLLILDEVGIQFGSDTEKLILFDVLNERYEKRKPTLLLSNLTLAEVRDYLGERIFDRLREDGGQVLVFDWSSHRGIDRKTAAAGGDA